MLLTMNCRLGSTLKLNLLEFIMQFNFKLRTALLVAALAFGINLLIIEKNAMAQPAAPAPASNASESTASTASEGKPATNNTPLTLPSLISIYISYSSLF